MKKILIGLGIITSLTSFANEDIFQSEIKRPSVEEFLSQLNEGDKEVETIEIDSTEEAKELVYEKITTRAGIGTLLGFTLSGDLEIGYEIADHLEVGASMDIYTIDSASGYGVGPYVRFNLIQTKGGRYFLTMGRKYGKDKSNIEVMAEDSPHFGETYRGKNDFLILGHESNNGLTLGIKVRKHFDGLIVPEFTVKQRFN